MKKSGVTTKEEVRRTPRAITVACVAALLVLTATVFAVTVHLRAPWFGYVHPNTEGQMTAVTVVGARNWFDEGLFHLGFGQYWEPRSIETPTQDTRTPYISFPPGAILPIYFIGKATGIRPSIEMVMAYNLANECVIAMVLALTVFVVLRRMGFNPLTATLLAATPGVLYPLYPTVFFQHQMGYYSDQGVLLPYVLILLLEALRTPDTTKRAGRWLSIAQGVLMFWGISTDWLFAFVALCLYIVRLARGGFGRKPQAFVGRSALFWLPILLALALFALQLYHLDAFDDLAQRFQDRAGQERPLLGLGEGPKELSPQRLFSFSLNTLFWKEFYRRSFGPLGLALTLASCGALAAFGVYLLVRRVRGKGVPATLSTPAIMMFLAWAPCLLYYQVFKNHCSFLFHSFTTLKFAIPMATAPFALVPATALRLLRADDTSFTRTQRTVSLIMAPLLVGLAAAYVAVQGENRYFYFGDIKRDHEVIGRFIAEHTQYEDVVFSSNYDVTPKWPQRLVYSWKLVHQFTYNDPAKDVYKTVKDIEGDYVVDLLSREGERFEDLPKLKQLADLAYETFEEGDLRFFKIRKADFLALCRKLLIAPPQGT